MKKRIRINESTLRGIIRESIKRTIMESMGNLYMNFEGWELFEGVFDIIPDTNGIDDFEPWLEEMKKMDPAIQEIADSEFTINAQSSYHNYYDEGGQNDIDFDVLDDDTLWDSINKIKDPQIKQCAKKVYDEIIWNENKYKMYDYPDDSEDYWDD